MYQATQSIRMINRRRYFRREHSCEGQLQSIDSNPFMRETRTYACVSNDISSGGVGLTADHHYPVGSKVILTMECPEQDWTRITSRLGTVAWMRPEASGERCQLGIRFSDIDDSEDDDFQMH